MNKLLILILTSTMLICKTAETDITRLDGSTISAVELSSRIESLLSSADVMGMSVTVFNENKVAFQESYGYANAESKDPLSNSDIFYGASFSKAMFGYLIAQLVEEGSLDLDVPLQDYLDKRLPDYFFEKEWKGYKNLKEDKRYEKVTARMCMNHTTGLPNWRWLTKDGAFFREGKIRFVSDPGERYFYSGEGIKLLQFVVEKIEGKGLEEMAQNRIFQPLGMKQSSYVWQDRFEDIYCSGHNMEGQVLPKDKEDEANAPGSLETTPSDYAKFMQHLLVLHENKSPITDILFRPSVRIRSMAQFGPDSWVDSTLNDNIKLSYGLGWGILSSPHGLGAFKEGHSEGFQHYSILFPEQGIGIIIMSNSEKAEGVFKELLAMTIGDTYTPWKWENYLPYDLKD